MWYAENRCLTDRQNALSPLARLRDANAAIAAYWLSTRRGAAAPAQLQEQFDAYLAQLVAIVAGSAKLPQQAESFDTSPGVSNSLNWNGFPPHREQTGKPRALRQEHRVSCA